MAPVSRPSLCRILLLADGVLNAETVLLRVLYPATRRSVRARRLQEEEAGDGEKAPHGLFPVVVQAQPMPSFLGDIQ